MRSFFRYPGGKHKLVKQILEYIGPLLKGKEYREPFFGGGSVGINVIKEFSPHSVWINDFDIPLADLWTMVINNPAILKETAKLYNPTVKDFFTFKELLTGDISDIPPDERGFMKLALHQMSYSGLGTMAGGPIGGKTQSSKYSVDCRWSPKNICKQVDKIHEVFTSTKIHDNGCTSLDYIELIDSPGEAFLYLDPPYYHQGETLYQYGFNIEEHIKLCNSLKKTPHKWVLSYDDCPEIIELYSGWSSVLRINSVNYSITSVRDKKTGESKSRSKNELLIISGFGNSRTF